MTIGESDRGVIPFLREIRAEILHRFATCEFVAEAFKVNLVLALFKIRNCVDIGCILRDSKNVAALATDQHITSGTIVDVVVVFATIQKVVFRRPVKEIVPFVAKQHVFSGTTI